MVKDPSFYGTEAVVEPGRALLDAIHSAQAKARSAEYQLNAIANVLDQVGSTALADRVMDAADGLTQAADDICAAWLVNTDAQIAHSSAMNRGILEMVISGVKS